MATRRMPSRFHGSLVWFQRCAYTLLLAGVVKTGMLFAAEIPTAPSIPVQFGESVVRPLPPEATLSQVRAAQIIQDNRGFLWIGTQYGLNRYDGIRMRQFLHDPSDASSLGGTYIEVLFKDSRGHLWISSDQSFDHYDPETEAFQHFDLRSVDSGTRFFVRHIREDSFGILWLGTQDGLIRFDPKTGGSRRIDSDRSGHPLFVDQDIKALSTDRDGNFWIATRNEIDLFDPSGQEILRRIPTEFSPAVTLLHEDIHRNLWAIVRNHLYKMDRARTRLDPIHDLGGVDLRSFGELRTMTEDRDGDMWFGTEYSGIIYFKQAQATIETFSHHPGRVDSLPSSRITAIFQDQRGDIWVGFHDTAPCIILRGVLQFRSTAYNPDAETGLFSPLVTSVFEESPNDILVGTSGVLQRQNQTTGELSRPYPFLDGTDVLSIYRDPDHRMWFGTDKGLYRIDQHGNRQQFGRQDRNEPHLSDAHVERILADAQGRMWVVTWNGLDLYNRASDTFNTVLELNHGENVYAIAEDADGSLWLGTNRGVKHFSLEKKTVDSFPYKAGSPLGPSDTRVNTLLLDSDNTLWVGTQSGLDRFDKSTTTFHRVTDGNGLGGQVISCIQEDFGHHLWMSTNQGILRFVPTSSSFEQYTTIDGLPGMDLTGWGACTKGLSQRLYFGGFSGVVSFDPATIHHSNFAPKVELTDLLFDGVPVKVGRAELLQRAISYLPDLSLPHDRNSFSLEFASLDFRDAKVERFRYRLEGIDKEWTSMAPGQHLISFSRLPRRHFVFHLQMCGGGQDLWRDALSFPINISPPWWSRWWMILVYSLLALTVAALEWNRKLRQVRALYEARVEGRVRERTKLARDLHDTLLQDVQGLILRFQSYLLKMDEQDASRQALTDVLNRAEESVIESRDAIQNLRTNPIAVVQLADAFGEYSETLSFLSDARVVVESDSNSMEECELDAEELFQIGKEAIRNAFQHAQATTIWIRIVCGEFTARVSIEDDGVGIPREGILDGIPGHWGIRGMYERAERAGFSLKILSRHLSGRGTEISVIAPRYRKRGNSILKLIERLGSRFFPQTNKKSAPEGR